MKAFLIIIGLFAAAIGGAAYGYQIGKATPCADEEQFEIHPMQ